MNRQLSKARTMLALGIPNLARVLGYRLGVKLGINPVRRIQANLTTGEFFKKIPLIPPFEKGGLREIFLKNSPVGSSARMRLTELMPSFTPKR